MQTALGDISQEEIIAEGFRNLEEFKAARIQGYRTVNSLLEAILHSRVNPAMRNDGHYHPEIEPILNPFFKNKPQILADPVGLEPTTSGSAGQRPSPS